MILLVQFKGRINIVISKVSIDYNPLKYLVMFCGGEIYWSWAETIFVSVLDSQFHWFHQVSHGYLGSLSCQTLGF